MKNVDLRHIAVVVANGAEAIVSRSFSDLLNLKTGRAVQLVNTSLGLPLIDSVSPEEVIEYDE
jgi:hypothetical protein